MKAIIMAGGEGSRLRPITCNIPKPLAKICGKPVIEYILELLRTNGFNEATLTLRYKADKIIKHFDTPEHCGVMLNFCTETVPLGTAGSVRNCINSTDEDILVISGDSMCDFNLTAAIEYHYLKKSDATIIVKRVQDPREYGLVLSDLNGKIQSFLEKPSYIDCLSEFANTGVYILSSKALELIKKDNKSDFAMDIFPQMLKKNMSIFAYEENGYWCDIGDIQHYIKAQRDLISGKILCETNARKNLNGIFCKDKSVYYNVNISSPSYIGSNVSIGDGSSIEDFSVICDNVTIGKNCNISGSIILSGAFIGNGVICKNCVICENTKVLNCANLEDGSVVGENAKIGDFATVNSNVKIWSSKHLASNSTATYDIRQGTAKPLCVDDEGICGETNCDINPQTASLIGMSLASISKNICIGHYGNNASKCISMAIISGILSGGARVWNLGECVETHLDFSTEKTSSKIGVYISSSSITKIKICSTGGLPITRSDERKLEAGISKSEYAKAYYTNFGEIVDISSMKAIYQSQLFAETSSIAHQIHGEITSSNSKLKQLCKNSFPFISNAQSGILFQLSSNGRKLSLFSADSGFISHEKLILLCCKDLFENGNDIALPHSFPKVADKLASIYNQNVHRYCSCPVDEIDSYARELAKKSDFVRDGVKLILYICKIISKSNKTLSQLISTLPEFSLSSRLITISSPAPHIIRHLCKNSTLKDGAYVENSKGRVVLTPSKTGKSILLTSESFNSETASELCEIYEKKISELSFDQ